MTLLTGASISLTFALLILPLVAGLCPLALPFSVLAPPVRARLLMETGNPRFLLAEHGGKCPAEASDPVALAPRVEEDAVVLCTRRV